MDRVRHSLSERELSSAHEQTLRDHHGGALRTAAALYALLIGYVSLFPLTGWSMPAGPIFSFLTARLPEHVSRADILSNILAYIPLGILVTVGSRRSAFCSTALAVLAGVALSLTMETLQVFLPERTASSVDLATNVFGALVGACIGLPFRHDAALLHQLKSTRDRYFHAGCAADLAIVAVVVWMASQLSPFVPSLDVSSVREGLGLLLSGLSDPAAFAVGKSLCYALNFTGLALLVSVVSREGRRAIPMFMLAAGVVLCSKPFIVMRILSPEALGGFGLAALALLAAPRTVTLRALLSMALICSAYATSQLTPAAGPIHSFGWIPLAGQLDNTVKGFGSILETAWPFVALASLAAVAFSGKGRPMLLVGAFVIASTAALEWSQQYISGRHGEITPVVIAAAAWMFCCLFAFWPVARRAVALPAADFDGSMLGISSPSSRG